MIDAADAKLIEDLIKRWRKEAELIEMQQKHGSFSDIWTAKDDEMIDVLRKCSNELEAILL